jgi:hypothetical protein
MYWLLDSVIHKYIYSEMTFELIPADINELWMRIIIVLLLLLIGLGADKHIKMIMEKEDEKQVIFNATINSTQHILNNLLNQMQFFKLVAEESNTFDDEMLELYDQSLSNGKMLVERLSSVEVLTEENIHDSTAT